MNSQLDLQLIQKKYPKNIESFQIENNTSNSRQKHQKKHINKHIKQITISILGLTFIIYRFIFHIAQITCINDLFQNLTKNVNIRLNQDPFFYQIILTIAQQTIEIQTILLIVYTIAKIKNLRAPLFFASFYGIRAFFLNVARLPYPQGIIWHQPGIYSFTVPYGITRDFFYSGHTGIMLFCTLQWKDLNKPKGAFISFLLTFYTVFVLLSTRVHYIIDIVGAIFFTLWIKREILQKVIYFDKFWSFILFGLTNVYSYLKRRYFQ